VTNVADSNRPGRLGRMTKPRKSLDDAVLRLIDGVPTPLARAQAPKDWQPGVKYDAQGRPTEVTTGPLLAELETEEDWAAITEAMGVKLPKGYRIVLKEASFDPAAWHRFNQGEDAVTVPIWRYRFQVVPAALAGGVDEDLEALFAAARKARRARPAVTAGFDKATMVVVLGDIQAGKVDRRGGTAELVERLEHAKSEVMKRARKMKPQQIVIVDGGDAMENFESSPGADRTNDLQITQQMRLWRRVFWDWVSSLAFLAPEIDVLAVPSNHCRIRRGKQNMSTPGDDYGLEVLTQLADIAAERPDLYGHVNFWMPSEHEEALALTLVGGKSLGVVHGHQIRNPDAAPKYLAGQAAGRTPIGEADVVVFNHFHSFWVRPFGDNRWAFGSPTMDSGSSWYHNYTGEESEPGVLTFMMDERGWRDLHIAWARAGVDFEAIS
jgi:hypothetical protein